MTPEKLAAAGLRVKPLEWETSQATGIWTARTALGTAYIVGDSQWTITPTGEAWFWVDGGDEAAKAAAQQDHEARILAALEEG